MKKKLLAIFIIISLGLAQDVHAQIPSGEQIEKINEKVDELKNKVASKVAQLNLVEKRGIIGIVNSVENNRIKITDIRNNTRIIEVDELTKFSSEENDSFDLSELKNGSQILATGIFNKDSQKLLARFVNEISIPIFIYGVVSETNEDEFSISIVTSNDEKYIVDIEKITKSFSYTKEELETSGFSKIVIGENIVISGYKNPKEKGRITASRLIHFPGIPQDPNVKIKIPPLSPTPSPEISK